MERQQTVVFLRHGIARHNVHRDDITGLKPNLQDPALLDPPLLVSGKIGAVVAGEAIKTWWHTHQLGGGEEQRCIELILTSPLTRCIQTAVLAFTPPNEGECDDGDNNNNNNNSPNENKRVPILCVEDIREAFGIHYPDKRRRKSTLSRTWSPLIQFDFDLINDDDSHQTTTSMEDEDVLWKHDKRESWYDVGERVKRALNLISKRRETNIVVVTHGVWIECCFHMMCMAKANNPTSNSPLDGGRKRVYNCDAYSCKLISKTTTTTTNTNDTNGTTTTKTTSHLRLENVQQIHSGLHHHHQLQQQQQYHHR